MNISRRRLMRMGLAGGAAAAGSSYWLQSLSRAAHRWDHAKFVNKLKIPPLLEGTKQGSGKQFNLRSNRAKRNSLTAWRHRLSVSTGRTSGQQ